jgi:hypothetical protein
MLYIIPNYYCPMYHATCLVLILEKFQTTNNDRSVPFKVSGIKQRPLQGHSVTLI